MICVPLRIEPPLYRRRVDFYTKSRAFDITRARTELGYAPAVDLEAGICAAPIQWYREQGMAVSAGASTSSTSAITSDGAVRACTA